MENEKLMRGGELQLSTDIITNQFLRAKVEAASSLANNAVKAYIGKMVPPISIIRKLASIILDLCWQILIMHAGDGFEDTPNTADSELSEFVSQNLEVPTESNDTP